MVAEQNMGKQKMFRNFGSGALCDKMLFVRIVEIKNGDYFKQVRLSEC